MSSFKNLRMVDNFYQTSAFFPMPTVLISTLADDGSTTIGAYSLCFPYYIAGKSYYAMLLECRNSSNTAQNILKRGVCALNFLDDSKDDFRETVRLGFPGETSAQKMKDCKFELEVGQSEGKRPLVISKAFQVMECSWDDSLENAFEDRTRVGQLDGIEPPYRSFNGITSKFGCHFILKIDKMLMKERFYNAIVNGVKASAFPHVPVDYGYRDSTNFWYTKFTRPIAMKIPAAKEADLTGVVYAANRIDDKVKFTEDACKMMTKVPRVFLKVALQGCVNWARVNGVTLITPEHMKIINDKRSKEKSR
ncbi:MAG: hypothetical protein PHT58_07115 [Eubacteriales bacterium]|nr:hypothetical protein [Eubacteriales bacterium]